MFEFEGHCVYDQNTQKQFCCQARAKYMFVPGCFLGSIVQPHFIFRSSVPSKDVEK
jgi:hypothetical protein